MVLFIDDNEDMLDLYRECFKQGNLDWQVFQNGYDALDFLEKNAGVKAVVLDLMMPTVDGLAVSQEIRRNENLHPDREPVKIAYFTAYDKTKAIERVIEKENVEKYFVKPMAVEELISEVKSWIQS
jgi:two-component system, sensor histidine kinase and response regulator